MKVEDIKKTRYGQNNLGCLVVLENVRGEVYFTDFTKNKFFKVYDDIQLNEILKDNKF